MCIKQTNLGKWRPWRCRSLTPQPQPQHLETPTTVGFLNGPTTLKVTRDAGLFSVTDCCPTIGELYAGDWISYMNRGFLGSSNYYIHSFMQMLLPRLPVASVCDQDPGRDGPHLPRHYQLGHSQYCCWRLVQFRYFQRRGADLPLEG